MSIVKLCCEKDKTSSNCCESDLYSKKCYSLLAGAFWYLNLCFMLYNFLS